MNNNFNLIRLIFAVMVIVSHSGPLAGVTGVAIDQYIGTPWGFYFGRIAVHGFFAVSGYLITLSWMRSNNIGEFMAHRFLRIAPGLLIAMIFTETIWRATNSYEGNSIPIPNGSLWTLSWEIICYSGVAALGLLGIVSVSTRTAFNSFFAAALLLLATTLSQEGVFLQKVMPALFCFLIGSFIAVNETFINMKRLFFLSTTILVILFIPATATAVINVIGKAPIALGPHVPLDNIARTIYFLALPFTVIYLAKYTTKLPFIKSDLSYGVYIYAWPIQQGIVYYMRSIGSPIQNANFLLFACLPIILIFSYASWCLIEKPAIGLKKYLPRRSEGRLT